MKRFVSIETCLWGDPTFLALSERAKIAYFFLVAHLNILEFGGLRGTLQGFAAELKWSLARFRKACLELEQAGWLSRSETAPLFWLPRHIRWNLPRDVEGLGMLAVQLKWAPDCELKPIIIQKIDQRFEELDPPMRAQFRRLFGALLTDLENTQLAAAQVEAAKQAANLEPQPELGIPPESSVKPTESVEPVEAVTSPTAELVVTVAEPQRDQVPEPVAVTAVPDNSAPIEAVPIPKSLRSPQFQEAWGRWLEYLRENQWVLSRPVLEAELRRLTCRGNKMAIVDLEYSMAKGYSRVHWCQHETAAAS